MPVKKPETPSWPADKVERRKVSDLVPYARNARAHSDAQVAKIAAAIKEWGWTVPILLDDAGGIIAGHGRVLAAKKLGLKEVPAMVAHGWTEEQKRAYVLADNRLAELSSWDEHLLTFELNTLEDSGFDLSMMGFDPIQAGKTSVREMSTDETPAKFWISLRGPLADQARVLDAIKTALGAPGAVEIELGVSE